MIISTQTVDEPMQLPYSEGSVFLVPLRTKGYARGVVARSTARGRVLYGYFFGPPLASATNASFDDLAPHKAILTTHFGDLGLINGEWPVIGVTPSWNRSKWPMPDFVRRDDLSHKAWRVHYCDDDPNRIEWETPTDYDVDLPPDSLSGYGAVEIVLTRLLDSEWESARLSRGNRVRRSVDARALRAIRHFLYFPDQQTAERVAHELRARGDRVETRIGGDDISWLVLVERDASPQSLDEQAAELEQIADAHGGEYDGWDRPV